MPLAAQVAVSDATLYYDKLYTYSVPAPLQGHIFVGSVVLAPFGRGKSVPRIGVVMALEEQPALDARVRPLWDAAPEEARLTTELLAIVRYLKEATFCTWYEAVKAVLPFGARYKAVHFTNEEGNRRWMLKQQMAAATKTVYLAAARAPEEAAKLSARQAAVLAYVKETGPVPRPELLRACGVTRAVPDALVKKGLLYTEQRPAGEEYAEQQAAWQGEEAQPLTDGGPPFERPSSAAVQSFPPLTQAQQQIARALAARMEEEKPKPALLYGVTGSGKTLVFLELVRRALESGRQALVLVPEIGLTPQMIGRLRTAFGQKVAVLHSGLAQGERLAQWRRIQHGQAQVVVGTRSAVFAPLNNIGILVVDEEQELSYQSESAPRYNALAVARRRAAHHGALLLLASATPAVADYHAAVTGRYELFSLPHRYAGTQLPRVEMVDMRDELLQGNMSSVSARLAQEIGENLASGQQTILLLNRRGYHRVCVCRACGAVLKCGECSVPLVYHRGRRLSRRGPAAEGTDGVASKPASLPSGAKTAHEAGGENQPRPGDHLLCHYCGRVHTPPPQACPDCGGELRYAGFGTQRLEEELAARFPRARLLRMDMDSTGQKGAHAHMLSRFAAGDYDILLGTQMVAKGLDFERVSLVGVVGIDSLLFGGGYRAYENVFALLTQVVGRSGRAGIPGRALIQTVDPNNPVLKLAAAQNYEAFYHQEIQFRRMALYPPFCTLCSVGFVSGSEADALAAARRFSALLAQQAKQAPQLPLRILGPAPMQVLQVAGSFRYRLTLKCRNDAAFRALAQAALAAYNKEGWPRRAALYLDFNGAGL